MKKSKKNIHKIIDLKYQLRHGMKSLSYLMDHILCLIFKIFMSISSENKRQLLLIFNNDIRK